MITFPVFVLQTPRACSDYWSEYRHCKSLWNRFHHYYTYGTSPSCYQWKEDYYNCKACEKSTGAEAKVKIFFMIDVPFIFLDIQAEYKKCTSVLILVTMVHYYTPIPLHQPNLYQGCQTHCRGPL